MDHTGPSQTGGPAGETVDTLDANRAALTGPPPAPQGLSPSLSGTQPTPLQSGAGPASVVTPKINSSDKQTPKSESVETSTGSTQDTFHGNQIDAVADHGAAAGAAVTQDTGSGNSTGTGTGTDQEVARRLIHSESSPAALESNGIYHTARVADSDNRPPVADNNHLPIPILRPLRTLPASVGSSPEVPAGNATAAQEGINGGENSGMNSPRGQHDIAERSPGGRYVRFLEKLGSGAYKDVYRAFDTIEGIEVAWNVVTLAGVPKTERSRIVNEVRLLERLHHNNIISFHGSWVNREKEQVIFVTEILSSGTLKSFINKVQVIRWKIAKRWAIQILNGLQYLHSYDPPIIHRDLKCDNIFINGTTGDLRIGDLGLSTMVSNKNKALSVLGTPEFMAPELYDEVYDEKIDIYAFGMCLLEIITKEVPYSECSNPAQIFKKVTKDIPPQSLGRVRSSEARDLIKLCLGIRNEQGAYPRPSAKELLQHPFLARGENDESEVEVDPPLSSIVEGQWSGDRESNSSNVTQHTRAPSDNDLQRVATESSDTKLQNGHEPMEAARERQLSTDESDHFNSMPDSELNMKKIKVLMGRGQEINDDENDGRPPRPVAPVGVDISAVPTKPAGNPMRSDSESGSDSGAVREPGFQYLVAAAVIHEEGTGEHNTYPNDVLKLVTTLPVEGQTQNVEFDFHLVQDDAVQVAREMVSELRIPESTVLEISEIISRLARDARMKQEKYNQQQRQWQQQQPPQSSPATEQQHAPNFVALEPSQSQQSFTHQGGAPIENGTHNVQMNSGVSEQSSQHFDGGVAPVSAQEMTAVQPIVIQENTTAVHQHLKGPIHQQHQAVNSFSLVTEDEQSYCYSDEESESPNSEELKKLEAEFQKNLMRAKKAFDTRMENLHRSKEEREAQHLKILEKHEKEKAEFEKRILQAEAEQTRRLDQLQKGWAQQRESLVKQKQEHSKNSAVEKRHNASLEFAYTPSTPPYPNSAIAENGPSVYPMDPAPSAGAVVPAPNVGMRRNMSGGSNGSEIR
eukprot:CAMPEP_0198304616 /NCGR_PEP_ID=MMETSP1449-20131203/57494_1 /TAXON_ID=420275 /ORGANISM="Attheya septentrionalis, Strain CCMP2084" /LENGTH=1027 /DNA_ID=CAMNT_0044007145 /DNA_START=252 /DNA_END=3335 /DNA_ORIENTATION=+